MAYSELNFTFLCLTRLALSNIITQANRGVVQLVEQRSPKPSVACSSRVSPVFFLRMWWNGRHAGLRNQSERVWVRLPPSALEHSNQDPKPAGQGSVFLFAFGDM